ncbi:MAG TPA: phosphoglycerate mutase, partial [Bacillota bacterium]|nr:phosphoglycerate mutase [Bacillota bacterium]
GVILKELPQITSEFRIMLLPDHPTPLTLKTHVADPVPFLIYTNNQPNQNGVASFDEESAKGTGVYMEDGHRLMERFIG